MLIEMHAHVIYGVDDGPETRDEMFRMLYAAAESGVGRLVCTSHRRPGMDAASLLIYRDRLEEARAWCRENAPHMLLEEGTEIFYSGETKALLSSGGVLPLAGTRLVLLEFSPSETTRHIGAALEEIAGCGWQPVLAHVERYRHLKSLRMMRDWKNRLGVRFQMNAASVLNEQAGFFFRRRVQRLLSVTDFVASDAHGLMDRPFCLQYAFHWLKIHMGLETAEKLCGGHFGDCLIENRDEAISGSSIVHPLKI